MMETKMKIKQLQTGINSLESQEQFKLDNLKTTIQMQSTSLKKLEYTVESGYQYYQQALKEKRELQDQWDLHRRKSTSP